MTISSRVCCHGDPTLIRVKLKEADLTDLGEPRLLYTPGGYEGYSVTLGSWPSGVATVS